MVLCLTMLPAVSVPAAAADGDKTIMWGASGIKGGQQSSIYFGTYQQSSLGNTAPTDGAEGVDWINATQATGNGQGPYYKIEPIKWRVLDAANDFNTSNSTTESALFLLSEQNLDVWQYNTTSTEYTGAWAGSSLRAWLNGTKSGDFLADAFASGEQAAIATTHVVNKNDNPWYDVNGGEDTEDKVFLLSITEVMNAAYGFDTRSGYATDTRVATNTAYLVGGGGSGIISPQIPGVGNAHLWWLRSPGYDISGKGERSNAVYVEISGALHLSGVYLTIGNIATRPAFNLDSSSILFTSAAAGGKPDGFVAVSDYSGNEWKLTLLDSSRSSFDARVSNVDTSSGIKLTIAYSGAKTGDNEYISAMIKNGNEVKYYGRLELATAEATNEVEITLPGDFNAANGDTLYIFNEQYNGDYKTDYASELIQMNNLNYTVTNALTDLSSNGASTINWKQDYTATLTAGTDGTNTAYAICDDVEIYVGGSTTALSSGYTFNSTTGELTIPAASITGDIKIVAAAKKYAVEVTNPATDFDFGTDTYGYSSVTARTMTIENTGNQPLTVSLPDATDDNFDISCTGTSGTLSVGGSVTITVKPKDGLDANANAYEKELTVGVTGNSSVDFSQTINAKFVVNKADATDAMKAATGETKYGSPGMVELYTQLAEGWVAGDITTEDNDGVLDNEHPPSLDEYGLLTFNFVNDVSTVGETATITVPVTSSTNYNAYNITVTVEVLEKWRQTIFFIEDAVTKTYGDEPFTIIAYPTAGVGDKTYSSSNPDAAEVDPATGEVTIKKVDPNPVTITVTADATDDYFEATASYSLKINQKPLTVQPKALTVKVNATVPAFELAYDGLVSGESLTPSTAPEFKLYKSDGTTEITAEEAVKTAGTYIIKWTNTGILFSGADMNNYALTTNDTADLVVESSGGGNGGGYTPPTYPPMMIDTEGGDTTVSPRYPERGDKVKITTKPEEGKEVDEVSVTDKDGTPVEVTDNGDGTYTFIQPRGKVTITVTYKDDKCEGTAEDNCPTLEFSDLDPTAWYHDGVHYAIENGLMKGTSTTENLFSPNGTTTRAQIVTILWRMENEPVVNYLMQFEDVAAEQWYTEAVRWAASAKIVEGYGNGNFGTNDPITREQLATILWRYAKYKGYDVSVGENTNILSYKDAETVSEYAVPAMQWVCGTGIIQGISSEGGGMLLDPQGNAIRLQAATVMMRFDENVTP